MFEILQKALLKLAQDSACENAMAHNPCSEFYAYIIGAILQIENAVNVESLASITWVQGQAALAE